MKENKPHLHLHKDREPHEAPHAHEFNSSYNLQLNEVVNLRKLYPISKLIILQNAVGFFAIDILIATPLWRMGGPEAFAHPSSVLEVLWVGLLAVMLISTLIKLIYETAQFFALQYETNGFRVLFVRGVFYKKEVSLPLLPVTEIYLDRDLTDLLFGLYEFNVATPVSGAREYGVLGGLSPKNAHGLEHFLARQLNRQIWTMEKQQSTAPKEDPHPSKAKGSPAKLTVAV